jgi:ribosomal protein S12 methylthiotransferase
LFFSSDISYYIVSLGCAKNLVDSERINGAMQAAGYVASETSGNAHILIVNTCGFIRSAKEESIAAIFDALEQAKASDEKRGKGARAGIEGARKDFGRKVVAVGCLTGRYASEVSAEIPEIDYMYGLPDDRFVALMSVHFHVSVPPSPAAARTPLVKGLSYSYIKISDGCSNNCSYCAIPLIRGPHRSFPRKLVMDEAREAAGQGARELVVVAQDISAYRWDGTDLRDIVREMSDIDGIEWIRLMYCHPDHIDQRIAAILAEVPKVVHYIDIPFQHANRRILRSMGRGGDGPAYLNLVSMLRERVPDIRIRSTFMVGYPGETEKEFNEVIDFLSEARLDRVGAFQYSPEEGTRAYAYGDALPDTVKKERYDRLMAVQQEISISKMQDMVGRVVRVLIEERVDEKTWIGRTEYDAPEVDGIFYLTGAGLKTNSMVSALVRDALEYDLIGETIG